MQTLDKILKLEPAKIFPGHGPVIDNPKVKIVEYVQHRLLREKQILKELEKVQPQGLTAEELVNLIYTVSEFSYYVMLIFFTSLVSFFIFQFIYLL